MQWNCNGRALFMPGPQSTKNALITNNGQKLYKRRKIALIMRLTVILLIVACLRVTAATYAQQVTYSGSNVSLEEVFTAVKEQTGYVFFYEGDIMRTARPVTVNANKAQLQSFLADVLRNQPLDYSMENKTIFIKKKVMVPYVNTIPGVAQVPEVTGRLVHAATGEALIGATVNVKGTKLMVAANEKGEFTIKAQPGDVLVVSFIGFQQREVKVGSPRVGDIALMPASTRLDETVVQAYGYTSKRVNTGNIAKVSGKELNLAPVSNVMAALQGRVPGMIITQSSGVPGSAFKIEIRGRTQIDKTYSADNEPLFIVDGVPLSSGNSNLNLVGSAISANSTSGLSPLSTINMADIESLEVLKDADATAIYGSRGANGVILITTRKGKSGPIRVNMSYATGGSKIKLPDLLSTKEYVAMRKEAFANDNKQMTSSNAYDLLVWDTTRDNNLPKQLVGGTASFTTAQASLSGGTPNAQYIVSGSFNRETDVYPESAPNTRAAANFKLNTRSANGKFTADFSGAYTAQENKSIASDLAMKLSLPPNYQLYDSVGGLLWNEKGIINDNPLASMKQRYLAKTNNLNGNVRLGYRILPELIVSASVGFNTISVDERRTNPKTSVNPTSLTIEGATFFGNNNFKSWIAEPQIEYSRFISGHRFNLLAGGTLQSQRNNGYSFTMRGYTSDEFLGSLVGVATSGFSNPSTVLNEYKYGAFFGRLNYNYESKYIVNISGRRDGSTRFGPNYRFSNFGAVGGAWLFTSEEFMKAIPFISFGKLRASYGITGNDRIGDYKYLDAYSSNSFYPTYLDSAAFVPSSLFKPDLHWERNKKGEIAVELGAAKDRILLTTAWYRNRSSDPLVQYPLPAMTGFTTITANLAGVLVDNTGWEITLNTTNIQKKEFEWTSNFNITFPKNKLVRFPGLAQTSYASSYIIGRPLNLVYAAHYTGVDPQTGLFTVEDIDKNGFFNSPKDMKGVLDVDPDFYGGFSNTFTYGNFQLDVLLQFTQQMGRNWYGSLATSGFSAMPVGGMGNVSDVISDRWQKPGDKTYMQKYTTNSSASNSLTGNYAVNFSDFGYSDASFIRLKNVALSYGLPNALIKRMKISNLRVYAQAQNLFTLTKYKGVDPETVFLSKLPPMRTIIAGIQLGF